MILEANLRDVKQKCRKFRNSGIITGVIKRKNGEDIAIALKGSDVDKYLKRMGDHSNLCLNLEGEVINTLITNVQRDVIIHKAINLDLKEIN